MPFDAKNSRIGRVAVAAVRRRDRPGGLGAVGGAVVGRSGGAGSVSAVRGPGRGVGLARRRPAGAFAVRSAGFRPRSSRHHRGFSALHAPASTFYPFGSFVFSYAAAVVIVGIGLLIGWAYQVSIPRPDQRESVHVALPPSRPTSDPSPKLVFVGRVTDMVECQWADPKTGTVNYAYVPLGRKYALASGLMEITYDTGVKVILQGPCTYRSGISHRRLPVAGSADGESGEERGEGRGGRAESPANQQSTISNLIPSPLSPLPSPLFTVRTPTAKSRRSWHGVRRRGRSLRRQHGSRLRGQGRIAAAVGGDADRAKAIRLEKDESARVEVGKDRVARVVRQPGQPSPFVRQMPKRVRIKVFNTGVNLKVG